MTTEDDFQAALDANPDDWHTRLVFADWLEDRGDPRAAGYRAIAAQQRRPLHMRHAGLKRDAWWWHCTTGTPSHHNDVPADWFARLPVRDGNKNFWPVHTQKGGVRTRHQCEDALARAFAKLPPERQAALLVGPGNPTAKASKPRKRKSPDAVPTSATRTPRAKKRPRRPE